MNILIIGGSGKTGQELIKQGLRQGHSITALVRDPGKIDKEHPKLKLIRGNVLDPGSLEGVMQDQDAVLSALGHKRFIIPSKILSKGTKHLIREMEEHGVKRFICITSLGIADSRFRLGLYYSVFVVPVLLFFYFRDKEKQEKLIRDSTLEWTIVRPGQLTNGKERAVYKTGTGLGHYILTPLVSRATVAAFMLGELRDRKFIRAIAGITN